MEAKRINISTLLRAGHKKADIVKLENVSLSTVKRVANRLKNNESLKDQPRSGRPQIIKRENVRKAFLKNPTLKMTEFAKKKKISIVTVSRAVKSEGGKSLKRLKRSLLTPAMVHKGHERCFRLLNNMKSHGKRVIIFQMKRPLPWILSSTNKMIEL